MSRIRACAPVVMGLVGFSAGWLGGGFWSARRPRMPEAPVCASAATSPVLRALALGAPATADTGAALEEDERGTQLTLHAARQLLLATRSVSSRIRQLDELVEAVSLGDLADALGWVDELPSFELRRTFLEQLLRRWAEHDPGAALDYAQHLPSARG